MQLNQHRKETRDPIYRKTLARSTTAFRRAINAIKNGEEYSRGTLEDYLDLFATNLENFRISEPKGEFDDLVVENIKSFLPYRDQAVEVFMAIAQYDHMEDSYTQIHRFFERMIPYLSRPEGVTRWSEWGFDNFQFIIHELFLYCMATFIKKGSITSAAYMLNQRYFFTDPDRDDHRMQRFTVFDNYLNSLEHRNRRLELKRLSLRADLIKERTSGVFGITFQDIMQADFVLFLRDSLDKLNQEANNRDWSRWWPNTLIYTGHRSSPFEIFARAQQKESFDKLKRILGIQNKANIDQLVEAFSNGKIEIPNWGGMRTSISPIDLMNYKLLATL